MINEDAGRAIGDIIVREVSRLPPLLAVAISYETAQTGLAMYLAYETAEHCMARLRANATTAVAIELEGRLSRYTGEDEHFASSDRLGRKIGEIFNTGHWINPASPVLLDIDNPDPVIEAWEIERLRPFSSPSEDPRRRWKLPTQPPQRRSEAPSGSPSITPGNTPACRGRRSVLFSHSTTTRQT
jgi:hypothetical protein